MSIARRLADLFRIKANKALDQAEDPREVLDYSYERQLEMLTKVRRGVADVATSRKRLELQLTQLQQASDRLQEQATQAIDLGRDDLAREALTRRAALATQMADITAQRDGLTAEEAKLTTAATRLQARVEAFRTRKETIKATYTAAEAQTRVGEAVSGISEEMGDVGMAVQRAEDRTAQMQARAGAIDELLASGAIQDATASTAGRDDLQAALDAARGDQGVDRELAALKAGRPTPAVGGRPEPRAVGGGQPDEEAQR
ncbi:PspA/IM30 family protein [Dactylosporangium sp. AC04546]|uniref:PspA/IM30 family protein n=1 Tax=Dactylosporangium sp. AC04546 TaxID=2862460 RepID=UPI001EE0E780|nr:PspA/IM30 family protein [Dactylosporangium sp. AC04546]WVK88787.1 PspA/IM30 family protein [Dactylosporangium sp. AC04546]